MRDGHADTGGFGLGVREVVCLTGIVLICSVGCEEDSFFVCSNWVVLMERCSPGEPDREGNAADERPESCVGLQFQWVGLGRCETDADCARFTGTTLIPAGADPPHSRCIALAPLGERFCEGFTGPGSWIDGQCEPGWPCGTTSYHHPDLQHCVSQQTRTTGVPAYIVACIPGPPTDLVDPRCGEPRYP